MLPLDRVQSLIGGHVVEVCLASGGGKLHRTRGKECNNIISLNEKPNITAEQHGFMERLQ